MNNSKSKDPAVLWYYRDYLSGTEDMSFAEQGAYTRLLNKQADKGHLSMDTIKKTLKKEFDKLWPTIAEKFLIDESGNYYNERMDIESQKRKITSQKNRERINAYWESVRNNAGNTTEYSTVQTSDIPIANANANAIKESKEVQNSPDVRSVGLVPDMLATFKVYFPKYPADPDSDFAACLTIAYSIGERHGWSKVDLLQQKVAEAIREWDKIVAFVSTHKWFKTRSISDLAKEWQRLMQAFDNQISKEEVSSHSKSVSTAEQIRQARAKLNQP